MTTQKVNLTEYGKLAAERFKEERKRILEDNGGEYVETPWYYPFLSDEFKIEHGMI